MRPVFTNEVFRKSQLTISFMASQVCDATSFAGRAMKQSDYSGNPLRGHASSAFHEINPFKMRMELVLGPGLSNESHRILKPERKGDDVRVSFEA
ncbi:hypothetical protein CDAR_283841 [Caerostris darwini]|uniref:Uncharacterized protein n=1 Tax=Caerostris darwini TaxID=1538125 RepID=A0AAV4NA73_9ARAC|nr:hypothetical protein CDAR_283841 [Caerostris darwini]